MFVNQSIVGAKSMPHWRTTKDRTLPIWYAYLGARNAAKVIRVGCSLRKLTRRKSIKSDRFTELPCDEFFVVYGWMFSVDEAGEHGLAAEGRVPRHRSHLSLVVLCGQERLVCWLLRVTDDVSRFIEKLVAAKIAFETLLKRWQVKFRG